MQTSATLSDTALSPIQPLHLQIPAVREKLSEVVELMVAYSGEAGWNQELSTLIDLVLEELLINIIDYGYPDRPAGTIQLTVESQADSVCIHLLDDGIPFDPFLYEMPDQGLSLQERTLGGLGLYLVKSLVDNWHYQYSNGNNRSVITKNI